MKVGVLGGGQLGQMLSQAGTPLGLQVVCLEKTADCPASLVGPVVVGDPGNDEDVATFAATVDVLTYETESLPLKVQHALRPSYRSLRISQDRWLEKQLFAECSVPCAPTVACATEAELRAALTQLPRLVKTRTGGYDGRGQVLVRTPEDIEKALPLLEVGVVVEELVPFDREVSVIGARDLNGRVATWWVTENGHREGILRVSRPLSDTTLQQKAERILRVLLEQLDHVGVLTLELFVVGDRLVANEMAPRVHNSGHWTIEGSQTSQFEQHLRAICGLPLGMPGGFYAKSGMVNLIGTVPRTEDVLAVPGAHLHLYGKEPRAARKLGHITVMGKDDAQVSERLQAVMGLVESAQ